MALVHNGFLTFRLFAAYQTAARLGAGLTDLAIRLSERRSLTSTNVLRNIEQRSSWSRQPAWRHLPGSVFDARYKGLMSLDKGSCDQGMHGHVLGIFI
jgi:hypothetical protein